MWTRRIEQKITGPLADGFRFAEGLAMFKDRMRTLPEAAAGLKAIAQDGSAWIDGQLAGKQWVCGNRFTLADIVLYNLLDFGAGVGQARNPEHKNLAPGSSASASGRAPRRASTRPRRPRGCAPELEAETDGSPVDPPSKTNQRVRSGGPGMPGPRTIERRACA